MTERYLEKILIIDDDTDYCDILENSLSLEGLRAESVNTGAEALTRFTQHHYDIIIMDINLPDVSGIQIITRIKESKPETQVIVVTAVDTVGSAVESLKHGAFDVITKPIMMDDVIVSVKKAIRHKRKEESVTEGVSPAANKILVGKSACMQDIIKLINKVAPTDSMILITGESGTGKELIAHNIYENSPRKDKPFVKISCAALPETLLESELFGYLKGSFTGATSNKKGLFEVAHGGTLFLDEISEVSPGVQAKLLRALQEKEIKPIGGTKDIPIDVRFITATNKDLTVEIAKGSFREDLYYRLNVINISSPSLRERKEDIPELIEHFITKYTPPTIKMRKKVSPEVMDCFYRYRWPGNIRELENVIERAIILGTGEAITLNDIPDRIQNVEAIVTPQTVQMPSSDDVLPLDLAVESLEKDLIGRALRKSRGVVSSAAKLLAIKRTTLIAKMKKLGLK